MLIFLCGGYVYLLIFCHVKIANYFTISSAKTERYTVAAVTVSDVRNVICDSFQIIAVLSFYSL